MLRSRDYTPQELEYVCVLWKMVNEEFLANKARAEEDEGQHQAPAVERERESEDDAAGSTPAISNRLRSTVPKELSDPRPAAKPAAKTPPGARPRRGTVTVHPVTVYPRKRQKKSKIHEDCCITSNARADCEIRPQCEKEETIERARRSGAH